MKKLFIIAVSVIFATIACKGGNTEPPTPPPPPILPEATIKTNDLVWIRETYYIVADLNKETEDEVTIKITNANPEILTISSEEIKIAKGEKNAKVSYVVISEGRAKVSFTSLNADIKTPECRIFVMSGDNIEYPQFESRPYSAVSKIVIGTNTIESSAKVSPDGADKPLIGYDDFGFGGIADDKTSTRVSLTEGTPFTIYYDNFNSNDETEMAVVMYIDWNGDGTFSDTDERVLFEKGIYANAKKELSGTISIPKDAFKSSRIRVICYAVEGGDIKNGLGYAFSGNFIDFCYSNK